MLSPFTCFRKQDLVAYVRGDLISLDEHAGEYRYALEPIDDLSADKVCEWCGALAGFSACRTG